MDCLQLSSRHYNDRPGRKRFHANLSVVNWFYCFQQISFVFFVFSKIISSIQRVHLHSQKPLDCFPKLFSSFVCQGHPTNAQKKLNISMEIYARILFDSKVDHRNFRPIKVDVIDFLKIQGLQLTDRHPPVKKFVARPRYFRRPFSSNSIKLMRLNVFLLLKVDHRRAQYVVQVDDLFPWRP